MTVFVLKDPQTLVAMQPADFASEDHFQALLADFPSLLSGDQGDGTSARRWMLIKREKSVPAQEGGRLTTSSLTKTACQRWLR